MIGSAPMFEALHGSINAIQSDYKDFGKVTSLGSFFGVVINTLLGVTFGISLIGIAYALFQFVISRGDKDMVGKAKSALTWSVIAMLITLLVVIFKSILYSLLGFTNDYTNTTPEI
jgi:hypothetical protein